MSWMISYPKQLSTDSDSDNLGPEPTGGTIYFRAPRPPVPTSSQTSIAPSTPGISWSFSLEIAPVQSTDCSRGRKRMCRPQKRIYARSTLLAYLTPDKILDPTTGSYSQNEATHKSEILENPPSSRLKF